MISLMYFDLLGGGGGGGWIENYHKRENWRHYCYASLASLLSYLKCNSHLNDRKWFQCLSKFSHKIHCTSELKKRTGRGRWGLNKDMVRSLQDVNPLNSLTSSPPFPTPQGGLYESWPVTWLHLNHSLCTNLPLLFPLAISISLSCLHHSTKRTYH